MSYKMKAISLLLTVVMLFNCVPAMAAGTDVTNPTSVSAGEQAALTAEDAGDPSGVSLEEPAVPGEYGETYATSGIIVPVTPRSLATALAVPAGTTPMTAAEMDALFTYTGSYEGYWYYENGSRKWFVMFLTDGTFTPKVKLDVDVFLVGGGAGGEPGSRSAGAAGYGGAGGYTATYRNHTLSQDSSVSVTIGAGGPEGSNMNNRGGTTYFGSLSAEGGVRRNLGGSAGGSSAASNSGRSGEDGNSNGGGGQGTTTYAFEGDKAPFNGMLFSGGGGGGGAASADLDGNVTSSAWGGYGGAGGGGTGGGYYNVGGRVQGVSGTNGTVNTGGGGGGSGGKYSADSDSRGTTGGGKGGSGIVILRNVNSPPTSVGTITVPASVYMWTISNAVTASWVAATDPDGDAITYTVEYAVNGSGTYTYAGTATGTSYSLDLSSVKPGNVRFRITPTDSMGNTGQSREADSWTACIYNTLPTTPANMRDPAAVNSWETTAITFTWDASYDPDPGQTVTYQVEESVNGGVWTSVQSGTSTTFTHYVSVPFHTSVQLRVRAYDGYDYSSSYLTSSAVIITHDLAAPLIQVVATPDANTAYVKDEVTITVITSDAVSGLKSLTVPAGVMPAGNQVLSGSSATKTFKTSVNGTFTFTVTDNAGNSASQSVSTSKIDADNPVITYTTSLPAGEFTNGDVTITLDMSDSSSGLSSFMSLNGQESVSGQTAQKIFTAAANGVYPFSVTDMVGHNTAISVVVDMIDRVKPAAYIVPRVRQWTNAASVTLDITGTDDYAGVRGFTLPNGSFVNGEPAIYEIFNNGEYAVTATDCAGNISDPTTLNYAWFDRTPPTITSLRFDEAGLGLIDRVLSLFNKNIVTNKQIKMMISHDDTPDGNEAESGVEWILYRVYGSDGTPKADWISTRVNDPIPNIEYEVNGYVEVQVVDRAGNYSDMERYDILLDFTPPAATYTLSETGVTNQPVVVTLHGEDGPDGSGFRGFTLPEGNVFVPESEIQYTFYDNGTRTFTGRDNAGNQTSVTVTITNIKNAPPVVEDIVSEKISAADGSASKQQIKLTVIAKDAGALKIYYCITPGADIPDNAEWQETPDGVVYIETEMMGVFHAKALDIASNWSNTMSRDIILDCTPPVINGVGIDNTGENLLDSPEVVLGIKENVNDGSVFTVDAADNFGVDKVMYCVTDKPLISDSVDWQEAQNGVFRLPPNIKGYLHIRAVDLAANESETISREILLDGEPPVVEDILFEKAGGGLLAAIKSLFGFISNERIKATITATDNIGFDKLLYCVTPGADIPDDVEWQETPDGVVYFDTEINGIIHVKTTDLALNESDVVSRSIILDTAPPTLTIEYAERENDFEPVVIKVLADDDSAVAGISGVAGITLPTGELIKQNYLEYTIKVNGTFVFKATDNAGNETAQTVEIDYIRPVLPEDWENNAPVIDAVLHAVGKYRIDDVNYDDVLNLRYLDLSSNGLESLPEILGYGKNITHLDLRGNEFTEIPQCVFRLKSLEYLDLSNNDLTSISDSITKMRALDYLDVSLNYLVDYDCPVIVDNYRDAGNFTVSGRPDMYSFLILDPEAQKEYVGNTTMFKVAWSYNDEDAGSLEAHRKALFSSMYPLYRSYRPLVYRYEAARGQIKAVTPDYVQIYLPESGTAAVTLELGA